MLVIVLALTRQDFQPCFTFTLEQMAVFFIPLASLLLKAFRHSNASTNYASHLERKVAALTRRGGAPKSG